MKKLTKSSDDAIVSGVLAGIAEYFDIDPVLVRVIFIVAAFGSLGTFILIYAVLAFIMPEEPKEVTRKKQKARFNNLFNNQSTQGPKQAEDAVEIDEDEWSDF